MNELHEDGVERVQILRIRPGDILILFHPGRLSQESVDRIKSRVETLVGPGIESMILSEGMTATVLRPEEPEILPTRKIDLITGEALPDLPAPPPKTIHRG